MAVKYDEYFSKASEKYGVDKDLLIAVAKTESGINAEAVSGAGAVGVMQLMPTTAKSLGVKNSYDPEQNIMGGAKYLSQLLKQFNGNTDLALSAYNGGVTAVKKYGGVLPYTTEYIAKVNSYRETGVRADVPIQTDLVWWGDVIRVIVILGLIALSVILISIGIGKGSNIKEEVIKTVVSKGGKT